jgi:hypothetical protein
MIIKREAFVVFSQELFRTDILISGAEEMVELRIFRLTPNILYKKLLL